MHYGDKIQLKKEQLKLVVYKHGTENPKKFEYRIISIQNCKYFPIRCLNKILQNTNRYFTKYFATLKDEEYYEVNISSIDGYSVEILNHKNVSNHKDELKRLH